MSEESDRRIVQALRGTSHAAEKAATVAVNGPGATGVSTDEWLAALRELGEDIALEFTPEDALFSAYLYVDNGRLAVKDYPTTPEAWDESDLGRFEAGALLEGGFLIRPVARSEVL